MEGKDAAKAILAFSGAHENEESSDDSMAAAVGRCKTRTESCSTSQPLWGSIGSCSYVPLR